MKNTRSRGSGKRNYSLHHSPAITFEPQPGRGNIEDGIIENMDYQIQDEPMVDNIQPRNCKNKNAKIQDWQPANMSASGQNTGLDENWQPADGNGIPPGILHKLNTYAKNPEMIKVGNKGNKGKTPTPLQILIDSHSHSTQSVPGNQVQCTSQTHKEQNARAKEYNRQMQEYESKMRNLRTEYMKNQVLNPPDKNATSPFDKNKPKNLASKQAAEILAKELDALNPNKNGEKTSNQPQSHIQSNPPQKASRLQQVIKLGKSKKLVKDPKITTQPVQPNRDTVQPSPFALFSNQYQLVHGNKNPSKNFANIFGDIGASQDETDHEPPKITYCGKPIEDPHEDFVRTLLEDETKISNLSGDKLNTWLKIKRVELDIDKIEKQIRDAYSHSDYNQGRMIMYQLERELDDLKIKLDGLKREFKNPPLNPKIQVNHQIPIVEENDDASSNGYASDTENFEGINPQNFAKPKSTHFQNTKPIINERHGSNNTIEFSETYAEPSVRHGPQRVATPQKVIGKPRHSSTEHEAFAQPQYRDNRSKTSTPYI